MVKDDKLNQPNAQSVSSTAKESDSNIELGLAEVVNGAGSGASVGGAKKSGSADPLQALADAGDYRALLNAVEPLVEAAAPDSLDAAKVWWLRASVKLETPEQFLLGAISEVSSSSIPRNGKLGVLVRESLVDLHSAGAVLLASELTRVLDASFAPTALSGGSTVFADRGTSESQTSFEDRSMTAAAAGGSSVRALGSDRERGSSSRSKWMVAALVFLVVSGSAILIQRQFRKNGEVALATLGIPMDSSSSVLAPPALPPVVAPSALDKVLGAIEGARSPSKDAATGGNSKVSPKASGTDGSKSGIVTPPITTAINWDGPIEPAEVREAIASGDPASNLTQQDENTARRLFGDPPPITKSSPTEVFPPSDRDFSRSRTGRRTLDSMVEYRAVVRTIASREAKFTSPRVAVLEEGDHVFVDLVDGPFLRVRLPDGGSGFVLSQDMEEATD